MQERDLEGVHVHPPQLGERQAVDVHGALVLANQRQVGDRPIVGRQRHRSPLAEKLTERKVGQRGVDRGLHVARRAQVERYATRLELRDKIGVVRRGRAVRDARRVDRQRASNLGRAAPLAGVDGDAEAAGPGRLERVGVEQRIREGGLRTGEVEAGQAVGHVARRLEGDGEV